MTHGNDSIKDELTKALRGMHDSGYAKGRVDAVRALSTSFHIVYDLGILTEGEKGGYKIALDTLDSTLKILEQDTEESGF